MKEQGRQSHGKNPFLCLIKVAYLYPCVCQSRSIPQTSDVFQRLNVGWKFEFVVIKVEGLGFKLLFPLMACWALSQL